MVKCKFCQSTETHKSGFVRGLQRYKCQACKRMFTETALRGVPHTDKLKALLLYSSGLSMNRIAKLFGVSTVAVLKWIRVFGKDLCPKPDTTQKASVIVMEGDEFWPFIQERNKSSGFSKPMIVMDEDALTGKSTIILIKPSNASIPV